MDMHSEAGRRRRALVPRLPSNPYSIGFPSQDAEICLGIGIRIGGMHMSVIIFFSQNGLGIESVMLKDFHWQVESYARYQSVQFKKCPRSRTVQKTCLSNRASMIMVKIMYNP